MPTPREAYTNTVDERGYSNARLQAADFGAAGEIIGRAAEGLGRDIGKVARDVDEIQKTYATAAAKDADAQAALRLQAIGNSYSLLEQNEAIEGKEKAISDIDALEKEMTGALKNPRAQRMFTEVFRQRKLAVLGSIQTHEGKEVLRYADAKSEAREKASATIAVDTPDEDAMFKNIETAIGERWSRMRGASEEAKSFEAYTLRSNVLARRAQTIRDPLEQEAFRQKHASMISPEDELVIIRANAAGLVDAQAAFASENFAAWRAGGRDPSLIQSPTSPVTHIDDDGTEVPTEGIVQIDVPPSRAAQDTPESGTSRLAAPRTTAVVKGSDYDPLRGIGSVTQTPRQHQARNGGTGRVAIDIAAPPGTAVYPPTRGKVVEVGHNDGNGNYIRIDYGGGVVGTYIHLKSRPPVDKDAIVDTSSVVGLVGNTGASRGNHLDYSVKVGGAVADPTKVTYRGYEGDGESRAAISELEQFKPEDADTTTLVADIRAYARAAGLSRVQERQLLRDQMEVVNFNRGLQQDQERIASRTASEWLVGIGDRPFKISEVPGFSKLSPDAQQSFISAAEIRSRPVPVAANGEGVTDMEILAIEDPEAFLAKDLNTIAMTPAERSALEIKKAKIRKGEEGGTELDVRAKAKAAGDLYLPSMAGITGAVDKPEEKQLKLKFYDHLERLITARVAANGGKPLPPGEYDRLAAESAMTVIVKGEKVPLFMANEKGDTVKMSRLDAAKLGWRRANPGKPLPSDLWFRQQMDAR